MNSRRIWMLSGALALLGLWYVSSFTEWLRPEPIQIVPQFRPLPKELVARRAERAVVALGHADGAAAAVRAEPRQYLNRLSDLLFVLARVLNRANLDGLGGDDVYWRSDKLLREQAG